MLRARLGRLNPVPLDPQRERLRLSLKKDLPYFKWYPADALSDIDYASMDVSEVGLFHMCLNYAWVNDGLPPDPVAIAKLLHLDRRHFLRLWARVSGKFPEISGRLRNERQEQERDIAKNKSASATESVKARYERTTKTSEVVAPRALGRADCGSVSESSEEPKKKENLERARETPVVSGLVAAIPEWRRDGQFMEFVVLFRQTGAALIDEDFAAAYQWAWRRLDFEQKAARLVAIREKIEADCYPDSQYVPKPQKFIQTEWKRPVAGKQPARKFVLPPPIPPPPEIQALWDEDDREKNKNAH